MIQKKKATHLEGPIEVGDIIKDYYVDGTDGEPDYYLILEVLEKDYLVLILNTDTVLVHSFRYDPTIQYEKVG